MRPSTVGATTQTPAGEVRQARPYGHGCLDHRLMTPGLAQRDRIGQSGCRVSTAATMAAS
jgi:hypothetical protein